MVDIGAQGRMGLALMQRPTLNIPISQGGGSNQLLVAGVGILAGINLRDATAQPSQVFTTASSANAAAANNVTIPAPGAGLTNWVTGFEITGNGATAGSVIAVTLTGVIGGTKTYFLTIPAGAGVSITPLINEFPAPGLPASGPNVAITLNVPSFGVGNTNAAASINGYNQFAVSPAGPGIPASANRADLLDGLDVNGEELFPIVTPAGGTVSWFPGAHGPIFTRGVFMSITAGLLRGAIYVKI